MKRDRKTDFLFHSLFFVLLAVSSDGVGVSCLGFESIGFAEIFVFARSEQNLTSCAKKIHHNREKKNNNELII